MLAVSRWYHGNHRNPFPAGAMSASLAGRDTGAAGISIGQVKLGLEISC